ncbi:hypothetical protein ACFLU8_04010 [Chloroflexota bacterium]
MKKKWYAINTVLVVSLVMALLVPSPVLSLTEPPCCGVEPSQLVKDLIPQPVECCTMVTISGTWVVDRQWDPFEPPWYKTGVTILLYDPNGNLVQDDDHNVTTTTGPFAYCEGGNCPNPEDCDTLEECVAAGGEWIDNLPASYSFSKEFHAEKPGTYTYTVIAWTEDPYTGVPVYGCIGGDCIHDPQACDTRPECESMAGEWWLVDWMPSRVSVEIVGQTIEVVDTTAPQPAQQPSGDTVGGDVFPVNKVSLIAPWIALAAVILAGGIFLIRRRVHSYK